MNIDLAQLSEGMRVVGPTGEEIGSVKAIRAADFLLDLAMRRDLYVPFSAIAGLDGGAVLLSVRAEEIGDQGWEPAPLFGMPAGSSDEADTLATDRGDRVVGTGDPAERGTWSPSSDAYDTGPLDTTEGRRAIEGADDGQRPRSGDDAEFQKLRDMSG